MDALDQQIDGMLASGQEAASAAIPDNADKAGEAIRLSQSTGIPAPAIHGDLDGFKQRAREDVSRHLVGMNPYLNQFVLSDPMAAKVSNDDLDVLDQASGHAAGLAGDGLWARMKNHFSSVEPAKEAFSESFDWEGQKKEYSDLYNYVDSPVWRGFIAGGGGLAAGALNAAVRVPGALIAGGAADINSLKNALTGQTGRSLERDLNLLGQVVMAPEGGVPHEFIPSPEARAAFQRSQRIAEPFLREGKPPPIGVDPIIDAGHLEQNQRDLAALNELLRVSQESKTRERAPNMYIDFIRQHTDREIGIAPEAVAELYGDKAPAPDDGILGFIPDLPSQMLRSTVSGADIMVPIAEWTQVDPALAKKLEPNIRTREGGITQAEAEPLAQRYEGREVSEQEPEPHAQAVGVLRQAAGLDEIVPRRTAGPVEEPVVGPGVARPIRPGEGFRGGDVVFFGRDAKRGVDVFHDLGKPEPLSEVISDLNRFAENDMERGQGLMIKSIMKNLKLDDVPTYTVGSDHPTAARLNGFYSPTSKVIGLRDSGDYRQMMGTAAHEALHAAFFHAIESVPGFKDKIDLLRREAVLNDYSEGGYRVEHNGIAYGSEHYGLTNAHEYISEAFTKANFREFLAKTKASPELIAKLGLEDLPRSRIASLWDAFLMLARKHFGLPLTEETMSLLDATMKLGDRLTAAAEGQRAGAKAEAPLAQAIGPVADRAAALGMTRRQTEALRELILRRDAEDYEAYKAEVVKAERKRQTKEWEKNKVDMRQAVAKELPVRPDFAADVAIRTGENLDTDRLTPEQRKALGEGFVRDGLDPDELAQRVGFETGDQMIAAVGELRAKRGATRPSDYIRSEIAAETDRRMEAEYGNLDQNILSSAKEQVLSQTQMDILRAEIEAAAGEKPPVSKAEMKANVERIVGEIKMGQVSSDAAIRAAGKAGREFAAKLLEDDPRAATAAGFRQMNALMVAKELRAVEKAKIAFDRTMKTYSKETVAGARQEFVNQLHRLMQDFGIKVGRTAEAIADSLSGSGAKSLPEFVADKIADGHVIHYPDWLSTTQPRPIDSLSVNEFRDVHDLVKSMVKAARLEQRIIVGGEKVDFANFRDMLTEQAERTLPKAVPAAMAKNLGVKRVLSAGKWGMLNAETILGRMDNFDRNGPFTQGISRIYTEAANHEARMTKEYNQRLATEVGSIKNLGKAIDNDLFTDPMTGEKLPMNRRMAIGALMNVGNADNLARLAQPYRVTKDQLWDFFRKHTTVEDWDKAQKIGGMFNEIFDLANELSLRLSDVSLKRIRLDPFIDPFGVEREGWYNPIAHNGELGKDFGDAHVDMEALPRFNAVTARSYTKSRTGYRAPLELDLTVIPTRMRQMIHDVTSREAVMQLNKIYKDPAIAQAIKRRLGTAPFAELQSHLERFAGDSDAPVRNMGIVNRALSTMSGNFIASAVGLNPTTVFKHGTSALAASIYQQPVGWSAEFARVIAELPTGSKSWKMAFEKSDELSHRSNTFGQMAEQWGQDISLYRSGTSTNMQDLRSVAQQLGSKPIAFFDHISSVPTWLAAYRRAISEGMAEGDAVYHADTLVRETHGSLLQTNRPSAAASANAMVKNFGALYNYFSEKLQQSYKASVMIYNGVGLMSEGEMLAGMNQMRRAAGLIFITNIVPAIIDYMAYHNEEDKKASWTHTLLHLGALSFAAPLLLARDMIGSLTSGHDISGGPIVGAMKSIVDVAKDVYPDKHGKVAIANPAKVGQVLKHVAIATGTITGVTNVQEGKLTQFLWDYGHGKVHPHNTWQMYIGMRYGTLKGHSRSFDDWVKLDIPGGRR